jgi:hypothetical protein
MGVVVRARFGSPSRVKDAEMIMMANSELHPQPGRNLWFSTMPDEYYIFCRNLKDTASRRYSRTFSINLDYLYQLSL